MPVHDEAVEPLEDRARPGVADDLEVALDYVDSSGPSSRMTGRTGTEFRWQSGGPLAVMNRHAPGDLNNEQWAFSNRCQQTGKRVTTELLPRGMRRSGCWQVAPVEGLAVRPAVIRPG